jgi:hypothetical protein
MVVGKEKKSFCTCSVRGPEMQACMPYFTTVTRLTSMGEGLGNLNPHESIQEAPFQPYELSSGKRIL